MSARIPLLALAFVVGLPAFLAHEVLVIASFPVIAVMLALVYLAEPEQARQAWTYMKLRAAEAKERRKVESAEIVRILFGDSGIDRRVTIVERDLKTLGESVTREFADVRKDGDARHLDLKGMIQGLANAQAERSKVPWQAIGVIVGILGVAGGLVYSPIKENQGEMKEAIHDRVTRDDFMTTLKAFGDRRDDAQRNMESRIVRSEGDIDRLQGSIVPPRRARGSLG